MLDNPILKAMAEKALEKHFKKEGITAILITKDETGTFVFKSYDKEITVVENSELYKLILNQKENEANKNPG